MPPKPTNPSIPTAYTLFFLYVEPLSALVGAYYAHFQPQTYLSLTHAPSAPALRSATPLGTAIALRQLANLYALFAVNEALVLRATGDARVWRTLLAGLLAADVGHLCSVWPLGWEVYYRVDSWNAMGWGNVAFVYVGIVARVCFLLGVGLGAGRRGARRGR